MSAPPPFPRVPHLVPGRGTRDDLVLDDDDRASLLGREVVVEEKLDGANVTLWLEGGAVRCGLRAGEGAMDRAGQLGPLRAWVGGHDAPLRAVLGVVDVVYAEWLLLTHTVGYDALPSLLVVLDLLADGAFLPPDERTEVVAGAGLVVPPEVWRGVPGHLDRLEALLGPSAFGAAPAEGVVVRAVDGREPRLAKLVRPGFRPIDDEAWRHGRPRNRVAAGEAWR